MGKFSNHKRLTKKELEILFVDFAQAVSSVKDPVEAASLIKDLLSEQESVMLARRMQVARCLHLGMTYDQIRKALKVSPPTIARVQNWLHTYGEGYRMVIERTNKKSVVKDARQPWDRLKNRYPMYFWPQVLLKQVVQSASRKEKRKILNVLNQLKEKTELSKELGSLIKQNMEFT